MEIVKKLFRKSDEELKCFEEIADVFHDSEKNFDLVFFPLCSINLNRIIPGRKEWIHFLDVWNNGNIEDAYFHEHRERDAIKFKLENSKYHYYGNEKAFPQYKNLQKWKGEAIAEFEQNKEAYLVILDHADYSKTERKLKEAERKEIEFDYFYYVDQRISYEVIKERYKRKGQLISHKSFSKGYEIKSKKVIQQIGGQPQWIQKDHTPLDKYGKALTFIGQVTGFHYLEDGSNGIFLFFNEATNEVVQIFQ